MSVSIHHIYSSVTLIFFFKCIFSCGDPSLREQSVASTGMAFSPFEDRLGLLQFTARADHSVGSKKNEKKVSFCRNCRTKCFYVQLFPLIAEKIMAPLRFRHLLGCFVLYFCVHSRLAQRFVNFSAK